MADKILTKEDLLEWLKYEKSRYTKYNKIRPFTEVYYLWKHQKLLRKTEYFINSHHRILAILYKMKLYKFQNKYCLHIPCNTCGKGFKLMHLGPVLINGKARIGENVSIHLYTGIVAGGVSDDAPIIGNGCVIGIGSKIVGKVKIADYVAIGANAVVTKDCLEENIAIAGVPAKKVSSNGALEWNKERR